MPLSDLGAADVQASDEVAVEAAATSGMTAIDGGARTPVVHMHDLSGHESRVFKASFSPVDDTLLATCSEDATCRLWDAAQCKQLFCLRGHEEAIYSVKFSPDGTHILTAGSDGKIIIWDLARLTLGAPASLSMCAAVQTIAVDGDAFAAQFVDSNTVVCAIDDTVVLWDVETATRKTSRSVTAATGYVFGGLHRNPNATPWVFCLENVAAAGMIAIGVSDASVRILDADLNERVVMRGHARDVTCLSFRSDGRELLSGSGDDMAGVWDLSTLQVRQVLKGHGASVHDCCYWPGSQSREVCTVSMDRTMRFWSVHSGQCLETVGPGITAKLCLAPNETMGGVAVAGGENKTHTGNDFRVSLIGRDREGLTRLAAYATATPGRLAKGALQSEMPGGTGNGALSGFGGVAGLNGLAGKRGGKRGKRMQE